MHELVHVSQSCVNQLTSPSAGSPGTLMSTATNKQTSLRNKAHRHVCALPPILSRRERSRGPPAQQVSDRVPAHLQGRCPRRPRLATASPARSSNTCPVIDFSFYIPKTKSPTTTGMYVRPTRIDSLHDRPSLSTLHLCPPCDFSISPMIIRLIPWSDQLLTYTPFIDFNFE